MTSTPFSFNMAVGDIGLWLHNKLGSTDDLWSGRTICAQLSQEKLQNIGQCFHTLQPHVKVKLMLSFLHLPRRNVDQWRDQLDGILHMAMHDTDQWVSMIGELLKTYPSNGTLNLELEETNPTFSEISSDLKKIVKKTSEVRMLPMECQFLNKTALIAAIGHQPQPVKHNALKRKPKSATLRAELLQKSSEMVHNKKHHPTNNVPIKGRSFLKKMDDTTPLKGFPGRSAASSAGFRSNASLGRSPGINNTSLGHSPLTPHRPGSTRKEGGIKLLDIDQQPVGSKEAKRRRKIAEVEAIEQQKKEAANVAVSVPTTVSTPSYTPDYALGLGLSATAKINTAGTTGTSSTALPTPTPSYLPTVSHTIRITTPGPALSTVALQARENLQQQLQQQLGQSNIQMPSVNTPPQLSTTTMLINPTQTHPVIQSQPLQQQTLQQQQQQQQPLQQQQPPPQPQQQLLQQQSQLVQPAAAAQPNQPRKGLSLTREQMLEAQEMFKTSNKVTRPEKALILGFMAGSRENPCPQQGDILSIRLSEDPDVVKQIDGTEKRMIVDMFFQMNYSTGEWKRIRKFREIKDTL